MKKQKIITGITVAEQMHRTKKILKEQVIPKEKQYQKLHNNMKNFEVSAQFIGLLFAEVEANTAEEAKEVFLNSIGASPNEHGDWSVTIENVSLPDSQFFLNELNMAFVEKITDEDKKHWEGIEIEEAD